LEHIAGSNSDGELIEFIRSLRHPDIVPVYISELCNKKINGSITSWQVYTPREAYPVEYIAGVTSEDNLVVFSWAPDLSWTVEDVSQAIW
jgi:hypothetical protein